jgi:hypothetical protein
MINHVIFGNYLLIRVFIVIFDADCRCSALTRRRLPGFNGVKGLFL